MINDEIFCIGLLIGMVIPIVMIVIMSNIKDKK